MWQLVTVQRLPQVSVLTCSPDMRCPVRTIWIHHWLIIPSRHVLSLKQMMKDWLRILSKSLGIAISLPFVVSFPSYSAVYVSPHSHEASLR